VDWRGDPDGTLRVAASPSDRPAPADVSVHLATAHADRIGYLASVDPTDATRRIAVWGYPRFMATDDRLAADAAPQRFDVVLPARPREPWHVRVLSYEDDDP